MRLLRSITIVALAFLVLVSSTSFMVGVHICMGEVKGVALFSKGGECEMERNLPPCHKHMKASCCEDETIVHKADEFKLAKFDVQLDTPSPITIQAPGVILDLIIPSKQVVAAFADYDPPLPVPDFLAEHSVLLI